jgi:pimeloyl-ACP methyl ester carboxylesterase
MMHNGTFYTIYPPNEISPKNETMIFIHGLGSSSLQYKSLVPHYQALGYQVLTYDLIGRGKSKPPANGLYGAEEHVEQLYSLLQHLQLLPESSINNEEKSYQYHLLGISMGGAVVALFASKYPQFIKSMILLCPAGLVKDSALQYIPYLRNGLFIA